MREDTALDLKALKKILLEIVDEKNRLYADALNKRKAEKKAAEKKKASQPMSLQRATQKRTISDISALFFNKLNFFSLYEEKLIEINSPEELIKYFMALNERSVAIKSLVDQLEELTLIDKICQIVLDNISTCADFTTTQKELLQILAQATQKNLKYEFTLSDLPVNAATAVEVGGKENGQQPEKRCKFAGESAIKTFSKGEPIVLDKIPLEDLPTPEDSSEDTEETEEAPQFD